MNPNRPYDEIYVLDNLNSFDYVQIISMMFKKWCMSEECWIDLKCLSVCCGWDLNYEIVWEHVMLNCLYFMKKAWFEWFQSVWWNVGLFSFKRTWFSKNMILQHDTVVKHILIKHRA